MAENTAWREASLALGEWLMTLDTVATETPAKRATSFIVAISCLLKRENGYTPHSVTENPVLFKAKWQSEKVIVMVLARLWKKVTQPVTPN
jgi:hypothetical protein